MSITKSWFYVTVFQNKSINLIGWPVLFAVRRKRLEHLSMFMSVSDAIHSNKMLHFHTEHFSDTQVQYNESVCVTQCVEVSLLVGVVRAEVCVRLLSVLLLKLAGFWVLVSKDEVQFVILTTLIGSKHDGVWSFIHKLRL